VPLLLAPAEGWRFLGPAGGLQPVVKVDKTVIKTYSYTQTATSTINAKNTAPP